MINLDHVESLLTQEFGPVDGNRVKGITDSGWFIDKVPLYAEKVNCQDVILCPPEISLRKGMNLWNARLPESCQDSHPDEPWSCFFGYRIYPTLKGMFSLALIDLYKNCFIYSSWNNWVYFIYFSVSLCLSMVI